MLQNHHHSSRRSSHQEEYNLLELMYSEDPRSDILISQNGSSYEGFS